jgi:hypothetical protein
MVVRKATGYHAVQAFHGHGEYVRGTAFAADRWRETRQGQTSARGCDGRYR